ncbi:MAG: DUF3293 domain-containing protein [Lysobacter sp.]
MRELQVVDAFELATAYAAARYAVRLDGDILPLQVGEPASDLEAYCPADCYTFISAWNPASEPHSDEANQTADALLVAQLDAAGAQRHAAWAESPDGEWREPGWIVADLDHGIVDRLAHEFGQAGVLSWRRGEPVRLRMLVERPRDRHVPAAIAGFTDWVGEPVAA